MLSFKTLKIKKYIKAPKQTEAKTETNSYVYSTFCIKTTKAIIPIKAITMEIRSFIGMLNWIYLLEKYI